MATLRESEGAIGNAHGRGIWLSISTWGVRAVLIGAVALSLLSTAIAVVRAQQELRTGLLIAGTSALVSVLFLIGYLIRAGAIARRHLKATLRARAEADAARTRLLEAIENINEGFVLFDAADRLVLCNQHYRESYPLLTDLMEQGSSFETIVRAGLERGQEPLHEGSVEARLNERLGQRERGLS
jgi:PAS domain-containing protein